MTQKLYPFSAQKHAHDVEFRRNRVFNEIHDGSRSPDQITLYDELTDLLVAILNTCRDGKISWLTGRQIGLAKECVAWAGMTRAEINQGRRGN